MLPNNFVTRLAKNFGVSDNELEVLSRTIQGESISEISQQLGVQATALQKRLGEVYKKFQIPGQGPGKLAKLQQVLIEEYRRQAAATSESVETIAPEEIASSTRGTAKPTVLSDETARQLIIERGGAIASPEVLDELIHRFGNHSRALQLAAETIQEHFEGNVARFLQQNALAIAKILQDFLTQPDRSLPPLAGEILSSLAVRSQPQTLEELQVNLFFEGSARELQQAIAELAAQSLVEVSPSEQYNLHPHLRETLTQQFIAKLLERRGYNSYLTGEFASAERDLLESLDYQSDFPAAYYNLGATYEQQQDRPNARKYYNLAVESERQVSDSAVNNLARLDIFEGEIQAAIARILPMLPDVKEDSTKASLYKTLGWAYLTRNCYAEAEENLQASLQIKSDEPTTHFLLAQVLEARGQEKKALEYWSKGLECVPRDRASEGAWQPPEFGVWCVLAYQRLNRN